MWWILTKKSLMWFFMITFSLLLSIKNPSGGQGWRYYRESAYDLSEEAPGLQYDFYRFSCPQAESIIANTVQELILNDSSVAPALLRLAFHDCFVEGCDASVLLENTSGLHSEKYAFPNKDSLRGYSYIDEIKSRLENVCPRTVSCADIIVLSARDAVKTMGGPYYPLDTGRKDGTLSVASIAEANLPSPHDELNTTLAKFMAKGFNDVEIVSLLGAHTIGNAHCRFFENRLYDFNNSGKPDPSMDPDWADELRFKCQRNSKDSDSQSGSGDPSVPMDIESELSFDSHYYVNVAAGRGVLYVDQSLLNSHKTRQAVDSYASDVEVFHRDFARAMVKLSNLRVLTGSQGQIRTECSKIASDASSAPFRTQQEVVP